ncbi:MAG: dTDP-4-dehydrorhamnose reductase [Candidatus Omnitrophica bacterium]|nr:dTDP-4-dehydrorhamnose reductase [Candidatus Omnitrophota bacterium]
MRPRVLITGSSGMLGVDLCQELRKDYIVTGTDAVTRSPGHQVTRFWKCDVTDKKGIADIIARACPDIVIHAAAMTDVDGCESRKKKAYAVNARGAEYVAAACKNAGAVMAYISTDFVFDGRKKRPYTETDRPNPLSVYAYSKLKGEKAVRSILKKYFILRTSWLYGRNGKNFVDTIIAKAKAEPRLKVVSDQIGCPTYTKDLAKAIRVLLDKVTRSPGHQVTSYGIYHVSNSGRVSWCDYAREILRLSGSKTKVMPVTSKEIAAKYPARRPAMSVLDNTKFKRFTGFKMRPWKEALKDYITSK